MRRLRGSMSRASDLLPSPSKRFRISQENMDIQDSEVQRNQRNAEDKSVAQSSDSSDGKSASGTSAPQQNCAAASRRLQKELFDLQNSSIDSVRDIKVDEANLLVWNALIVPAHPPFSSGAFRVELKFPVEYPFKPPRLTLKTKIYHPNFDEKGEICLSIVSPENWKPATRVNQVMEALVLLIHEPEPEHPLRADLAEEFVTNRKKFMKNAEEYTRKFADKRPSRS